jgi:hypothetical protein
MARNLEKARRDRDKARKAFADATGLEATAAYLAQDVARWKACATVHAQRAAAELSRKLVELRADVPIALDLDEAIVGGWDVREVLEVLRSLGCGWLGKELERRPKRAPRRSDVRTEGADGVPRHRGGARPQRGLGPDAHVRPYDQPQAAGRRSEAADDGHLPDVPPDGPRLSGPGDRRPDAPRVIGEARAPEDIDEAIVRARMQKAGPLARKYLVEDLLAGTKYALRPGVAEALIAEMQARGVAA